MKTREETDLRPWRKSPFVTGHLYRVKRNFTSRESRFIAGELLGYDGYEGPVTSWQETTAFFFIALNNDVEGRSCTWFLREDEDLEIWREYFEKFTVD